MVVHVGRHDEIAPPRPTQYLLSRERYLSTAHTRNTKYALFHCHAMMLSLTITDDRTVTRLLLIQRQFRVMMAHACMPITKQSHTLSPGDNGIELTIITEHDRQLRITVVKTHRH